MGLKGKNKFEYFLMRLSEMVDETVKEANRWKDYGDKPFIFDCQSEFSEYAEELKSVMEHVIEFSKEDKRNECF